MDVQSGRMAKELRLVVYWQLANIVIHVRHLHHLKERQTDHMTVVMRRALARLFSNLPLTESALIAIRNEFELLEEDLFRRISRISAIPQNSGGSPGDFYESDQLLQPFAKILLSAYMHQAYSIICHPILRSPVGFLWPDLYSR